MSANNSQPSTDPQAARIAAQTDHRHHAIQLPDKPIQHGKSINTNVEIDTSAYPEHRSNQHGPASPEKVAHRSNN